MADRNLIKTLVEAWGPSGYEHEVRALIEGYVKDLADEIQVDSSGNLICRMGSGGKKIMIAAHMDEIGMIVTYIDKDGFARFAPIGGLLTYTLWGNRVRFGNGVIASVEVEGPLNFTKAPSQKEMYLDITDGMNGSSIKVGDPAALTRNFAERGDRLIAKSMDDRIGCAVAIEAMRKLAAMKPLNNTCYFVFTVQEEVGIRGARTAAFGLNPDFGIALDVTSTGDTPKNTSLDVRLGAGAAIKVMDAMHIVPPTVKNLMIKRAEEANIPYQLEVLTLGSTDAAAIQQTMAGIPSGTISIPCRGVHTTSETVDAKDVQACIDLLTELLSKPFEA
ncbi:MAG: M42 family metallopeptidase [Anaerolineae bacterium]